ncbi:hypothetical protein [Synechococcus sp. CB0101]|uniref:hypothetical protein n=1 Tax=Synechococcus sp. CB0101 TaxID=232348 RepID=UPI00143D6280|nr:hypothetical protein [Synechococcus sp. CB0101]
MLPIALLVSIVSNQLVVLLFGRDYLPAAPLISILSFEAAFNGLSFIASQFFIVLSLPKILFYRQLFSLIPLISSIFLISYFEPTILMAFAMMVAAIIRLLCAFFYIVIRLDPPNPPVSGKLSPL